MNWLYEVMEFIEFYLQRQVKLHHDKLILALSFLQKS
jgi:hypothetical protein